MIRKSAGMVLFGCMLGALSGTSFAADKTQAQKAIAAAEQAQKKAAAADGEWRDTGKLLKNAKAAQSAGEYGKAVKLADQAAKQGQLGYEQANSQKELRLPSYLK